ncbi:single-stranded-DNA-specific exonuclease RecJ [Ruminococcus sp.]|uniref:single-stranded-DNA-specific exonuclease RecJ n=1 Tax=Ruminococcus sp. TaxID=41978 RepID=UPI00386CFA91
MKNWIVSEINKDEAKKIQTEYGLPPILAMLLQIRGITKREEIEDFLQNDSVIASPFEIKDMQKGADRILTAIDNSEPICVYGDYDADGVTSTALLFSYLETVGANAMYYIPSREAEGYGMNKDAIDKLAEKGIKLIITVDNGIAAVDEIDYANSLGIDTVITDHHQPTGKLPNAVAVIDMHQKDCKSKYKMLSGVGVAFKLVMALEGENCDVSSLLDNYSDLLCIGTVGDIVELKSENRVFVKRGLVNIQQSDRVGINALVQTAGIAGKKITSGNVSFTLVPRINAVGRLGFSGKSVSLLLTEDEEEANEIAKQLNDDNTERKEIEQNILLKIDDMVKLRPEIVRDRVLVIDGEGWHQGVIGIVASKIKEFYGKPTIILSRDGDEAKGSGRSVEGFSLCDAIFACSDLLMHYGGHPMAAGLSLKSENIELFRKRINEYALQQEQMPFNACNIDCKLNPGLLNVQLVEPLNYLAPYGAGNPTPMFGLYKMTLALVTPLSQNKHLRLQFKRNNSTVTVMKFFTTQQEFPYVVGDMLDLAVTLDINEFNGQRNLSIIAKEIKPSALDTEKFLQSQRNYEDFKLGLKLSPEQIDDLLPNREDFAILYVFLRKTGGYAFPIETLVHKLDYKLSIGKIRVILDAMSELSLVTVSEGINSAQIRVSQVSKKVDLNSADTIIKLRGMQL